VRRADNLTTFICRLSWKASTSWNPMGLFRTVMGLLYIYQCLDNIHARKLRNNSLRFLSLLTENRRQNLEINVWVLVRSGDTCICIMTCHEWAKKEGCTDARIGRCSALQTRWCPSDRPGRTELKVTGTSFFRENRKHF